MHIEVILKRFPHSYIDEMGVYTCISSQEPEYHSHHRGRLQETIKLLLYLQSLCEQSLWLIITCVP